MTVQEAINDIKRQIWEIDSEDVDITISTESLVLAIKALEKQIPKKPFKTMDENNPYYKYMPWCCPCCRETLYEDTEWGNQEFDYCTECGQKLDWRELPQPPKGE